MMLFSLSTAIAALWLAQAVPASLCDIVQREHGKSGGSAYFEASLEFGEHDAILFETRPEATSTKSPKCYVYPYWHGKWELGRRGLPVAPISASVKKVVGDLSQMMRGGWRGYAVVRVMGTVYTAHGFRRERHGGGNGYGPDGATEMAVVVREMTLVRLCRP